MRAPDLIIVGQVTIDDVVPAMPGPWSRQIGGSSLYALAGARLWLDARRIGQFQISLRQLLMTDDQVALDTVMMKAKDRIRIWSSRGADGSEYVQDGLVPAANNHETGWMERCDTRRAGNLSTVPVGLKSQTGF